MYILVASYAKIEVTLFYKYREGREFVVMLTRLSDIKDFSASME